MKFNNVNMLDLVNKAYGKSKETIVIYNLNNNLVRKLSNSISYLLDEPFKLKRNSWIVELNLSGYDKATIKDIVSKLKAIKVDFRYFS